jgi:hypothetical protein
VNLSKRSAITVFGKCLLSACLLSICGCQEPEKPTPPEEPIVPKEASVVDVRELPKLDEYLGPKLDGDRLQIPSPEGWCIRPRSSKYIKRFQPSVGQMYPSIIVTATDFEEFENVSPENIDDFAQRVTESLEAEGLADKLVLAVAPIKVGPVSGVSYRRRGKSDGKIMERLFIETVSAGRKYSFELRARTGTLSEYRPYLMAVVCGTKFTATEPVEEPHMPTLP